MQLSQKASASVPAVSPCNRRVSLATIVQGGAVSVMSIFG